MKQVFFTLSSLIFLFPTPVMASDSGSEEVIVTARRRDESDFSAEMPVVGIKRTADFAVEEVTITGDSRDADQRREEIYGMAAAALGAAPAAGVRLAFGDFVVQPLTQQNYRDLPLSKDSRPDTQHVSFLVKVPLAQGGNAEAAEKRINAFIRSVKPVGRALMESTGDLTLTVVAPDQYRGAIADAIAVDAKAMAAKLGDGYGAQIVGLNRPVEWTRSGLSDVLLYIPYNLTVLPKH